MAYFSFQLPETCAGASRDGVSFSGILEMCVIRGKSILQTEIDLYSVCFIQLGSLYSMLCVLWELLSGLI